MPVSRLLLLSAILLTGCDRPATTPASASAVATPEPEPKKDPPKKQDLPEPTTGRIGVDKPYVLGTVRVTIRKVTIGKVPLKNADGTISYSDEPRLMVALKVENLNDRRKLAYESWVPDLDAAKSVGKLTDDSGTESKRVSLGFGNNVKDRTTTAEVNPASAIHDLLLFEVPAATIRHLDLDLPGANVRVKGTFQFRIDIGAIAKAK
jgi:hypothetical protein